MLVVDSQIHLWGSNLPTNPAHRQITSYSAQDALRDMAEAGVDAAVIHPPGWDPDSDAIAVEAASQHPDKFAVLGKFPLDDPASASLIDGWKRQSGMLGLRFTFLQPHQQTWPMDGTMDWLWPAAEEAGLPVGLACAGFLPVVGQVAERHPGLKLIVDHMGRAGGATDAAAWETLPQLIELAKHPNVAVNKLLGVGCAFPALPLRQYSRPRSPDLRRLRSRPHVLGHRYHADALLLERMRDHVHGGIVLVDRRRQGANHGQGPVPLDRLGLAGGVNCPLTTAAW